ncbi:MAG: T9SS type A sorting domain-containing protein [Salinivirgaceae bacterium]|nr:T9SS type A sorting domain-containing protein [Salinivirgaceae bacterium]
MIKLKIIPAMALLAFAAHCQAQTAVATAGGEAGSVSFTVGQPFVEVATSNTGSITPGVQQAYQITVVEVGMADKLVTLDASVYPNPTTDWLTLTVADAANLCYTLLDANGRIIATDNIVDVQTSIDMARLAQGVYFVRVTDGDAAVRTFKVVKM